MQSDKIAYILISEKYINILALEMAKQIRAVPAGHKKAANTAKNPFMRASNVMASGQWKCRSVGRSTLLNERRR